jgi:hypothetical protein
MGLDVGVLGAEKFLSAVTSEILDDVGEFASAVIAFARITFRIFVREYAAGGLEHGFGREIFAGDQLEAAMLALGFVLDGLENVGVDDGQRTRHSLWVGHLNLV